MSVSFKKLIIPISIGIGYLLLFLLCMNDPFYGDSKSTISRLAVPIYNSNFTEIFYPKGMDPGHPIFFPLLHAFLWKLFGKNLIVSHLVSFILTIISLFTAQKIDKHYQLKNYFLLLVAINPIFLTLSVTLNTHIALVAGVLIYFYAFIKQKPWYLFAAACFMLLTHNEGLLIVSSFIVAQIISTKNLKTILPALLAFIPWFAWLVWHKTAVGWYLFPPEYAEFRGLGRPISLLKNLGIITWRLVDFGLFTIIISAIIAVKKEPLKKYLFHLLFAMLLCLAIWFSVKFSIAHRYFIPVWIVLSVPAAIALLSQKKWVVVLLFAIIVSGNFWYYPGKQLSDANILYRHYFSIYQQIQQSTFKTNKIYSTPPNESSFEYTHLETISKPLFIKSISEEKNPAKINCVMEGNVNGALPDEIQEQIKNWPYQTFESGPAWVNIYINPSIAIGDTSNWKHREAGKFEQLIINIKKKLTAN